MQRQLRGWFEKAYRCVEAPVIVSLSSMPP